MYSRFMSLRRFKVTNKNRLKDLSERVENIERQMKEDKEEQLKKLNAELDCAKFRCALFKKIGNEEEV